MDRKKSTGAAGQIEGYLRELAAAARALPPERRKELTEDVRTHLQEALTDSEREDPEAVRAVLVALGQPAEIVAAAVAGDGEPVQPSRGITRLEIATVLLLLFGAAAAGIGWLVGVLLLWASPRWTLRDKLLGTLVTPGGVALPIFLAAQLAAGSALLAPLTLVAVAVVASSLTAAYLVRGARSATVFSSAPRWASGVWAVVVVLLATPVVGAVLFMGTSSGQISNSPAAVPETTVPTHSPS